MAIEFNASGHRINLSGTIKGGAFRQLYLVRFRSDSAGFGGVGRVFEPVNLESAGILRFSTTIRLQSRRAAGINHEIRVPLAAITDWKTLVIYRGNFPSTSTSDHSAWIDGTEQTIEFASLDVPEQAFFTGDPTSIVFGNRAALDRAWEGAFEYFWAWDDLPSVPPAELLKSLSLGLHPSLSGLGNPALAIEFPGETRILTNHTITASSDGGYSGGAGSYRIWPANPIAPVTATGNTLAIAARQGQARAGINLIPAPPPTTGFRILYKPGSAILYKTGSALLYKLSTNSLALAARQGQPKARIDLPRTVTLEIAGKQGQPKASILLPRTVELSLAARQGQPKATITLPRTVTLAVSGRQGQPRAGIILGLDNVLAIAARQGQPKARITLPRIVELALAGRQGQPKARITLPITVELSLAARQGQPTAQILLQKALGLAVAARQGQPRALITITPPLPLVRLANFTARPLRLFVGEDEQDWSLWVRGFEPGYGSVGTEGLITLEATLEIQEGGPESIDPRANPARWREGIPVRVEVLNDDGDDWIPWQLRLLSIPTGPTGGIITLSLGCWLLWASRAEREGDYSDVVLGVAENAAAVAARLLVGAGIPAGAISLGTWSNTVAYPLVKEGESARVSQAAALAFADGHRHIYQHPDGTIQAVQWSQSGTPIKALIVGADERLFDPQPDPIEPVETIEVVGAGFDVVTQPQVFSRQISFGGNSTFVILSWGESAEFYWEREETSITQPSSEVFVSGGSISSTTTTNRTTKYYEKVPKGKLITTVEQDRGDWRTLLPGGQFGNSTVSGTTDRTRVETTYTYNAEEVLISTSSETRVPRFLLDPTTSSALNDATERIQYVRWDEDQPDSWTQYSTERIAAARAGGRRAGVNGASLVSQIPQIQFDSRPPATQRWEDKTKLLERHYEGRATWDHPGGDTGLDRLNQITVTPGYSNAVCFAIATAEVQVREGRRLSYWLDVELTDPLLNCPPLSVVTVNDGANLWTFRLDAIQWNYGVGESSLSAAGILIARVAAPAPIGTPLPTFETGLTPGQEPEPEPPPFEQPGNEVRRLELAGVQGRPRATINLT